MALTEKIDARIDKPTKIKLQKLADSHKRKRGDYVRMVLEKHVEDYERMHGKIK